MIPFGEVKTIPPLPTATKAPLPKAVLDKGFPWGRGSLHCQTVGMKAVVVSGEIMGTRHINMRGRTDRLLK